MNVIKKFSVLKEKDYLYLVEPSDPTLIKAAMVKEVKINSPRMGLCEITYYRIMDKAAKIFEQQDKIPTDTLIARMDLTSVIATKGGMPIPFFTDKNKLFSWITQKT